MAELDIKKLSEEFDIDTAQIEIKRFKDIMDTLPDIESADDVLKQNINRANHLLDLGEQCITAGAISPRILEVCAKLIDSITTAANSLVTSEIQNFNMDFKERTLDLKKLEVENKKSDALPSVTQQNNILMISDRESLLKMLREEDKPEIDSTSIIDIN